MPGIETLWPFFGLRIRSDRLVLRLPTDDDLVGLVALAKAGIHDPTSMPFAVPWSTLPGPAFERNFVAFHWRQRASSSPSAWDLPLIIEVDGVLVGSQSMDAEDFAVLRTVGTGSWLGRAYQGRGLGTQARAAMLAFAFDTLGAEVATTQAFLDNDRSNRVSRALGYEPDGIGRLAPEGIARDTQRYRMTAAIWRSRARPTVVVDGFEACRELLSVPGR